MVCARWDSFAAFHTDMGDRPEGCTLDRIDSNGNYESGNCRWATEAEQKANRRPPSTEGVARRVAAAIAVNRGRKLTPEQIARQKAGRKAPYGTTKGMKWVLGSDGKRIYSR